MGGGHKGKNIQGDAAFNPLWEDLCLGSLGLPGRDKFSPEGVLLCVAFTETYLKSCKTQTEKASVMK